MSFCASWLVVFLGTDACHWMFKTKSAWFKIREVPLEDTGQVQYTQHFNAKSSF